MNRSFTAGPAQFCRGTKAGQHSNPDIQAGKRRRQNHHSILIKPAAKIPAHPAKIPHSNSLNRELLPLCEQTESAQSLLCQVSFRRPDSPMGHFVALEQGPGVTRNIYKEHNDQFNNESKRRGDQFAPSNQNSRETEYRLLLWRRSTIGRGMCDRWRRVGNARANA